MALVEPANAAAPVAPEVEPTEGAAPAGLPDELLRIPAISALLAGQPAAVSASIEDFSKRPEGKLIAQNAPLLQQAGMGLYRSMGGDLGVLFNQMFIHPEEIQAADKAGKLSEIAPSFDQINQSLTGAGAEHPVMKAGQRPTGFKSAPAPNLAKPVVSAPPTPQAPKVAPAPQKQVSQKALALRPGSPTSGPAPGEGRLLNSILRPVY